MTDFAVTVIKRDGHAKERTKYNPTANNTQVLQPKYPDEFDWYEGYMGNQYVKFGNRKGETALANNDTITVTIVTT